jgi:hypothetical protein
MLTLIAFGLMVVLSILNTAFSFFILIVDFFFFEETASNLSVAGSYSGPPFNDSALAALSFRSLGQHIPI